MSERDDERLRAAVDACAARWSLTLGAALAGATQSVVVDVTRADGSAAVLKVHRVIDEESEHEADALLVWNGDGAVRLLAHDRGRRALLLEKLTPGTTLTRLHAQQSAPPRTSPAAAATSTARDPARALRIAGTLLPRLLVPVPSPSAPFTALTDEAAHWATSLPRQWAVAGEPYERSLVDAALAAMSELSASAPAGPGERVLLHQDLHADNILFDSERGWLAIDPKPLVGERAFALAPLVRGSELGHSEQEVVTRLDVLAAAAGVDRERARRWALAQTLAWGFEDGGAAPRALRRHVEVARWLERA